VASIYKFVWSALRLRSDVDGRQTWDWLLRFKTELPRLDFDDLGSWLTLVVGRLVLARNIETITPQHVDLKVTLEPVRHSKRHVSVQISAAFVSQQESDGRGIEFASLAIGYLNALFPVSEVQGLPRESFTLFPDWTGRLIFEHPAAFDGVPARFKPSRVRSERAGRE